MPMPAFVEATLQAALLSVLSNVLAQYIESLKQNVELEIDFIPVFQFVLFSMFVTPPNFLWQQWLEETFPAKPPAPHPKKSDDPPPPAKLSIRNTIIKLVIDQTLGAVVNTLFFSVFHRSLQAALGDVPPEHSILKAIAHWNSPGAIDFARVDIGHVWELAKGEFWGIYTAGLKMWPLVSLFNFAVVKDVQTRNLVGSLAGVVWGTYMSMVAAE